MHALAQFVCFLLSWYVLYRFIALSIPNPWLAIGITTIAAYLAARMFGRAMAKATSSTSEGENNQAGAQPGAAQTWVSEDFVRISANVTGDFGNVTDLKRCAGLREEDCRDEG